MPGNCKDTTKRKNKWLKQGLLIIAVLMTIYLVLFTTSALVITHLEHIPLLSALYETYIIPYLIKIIY